MASLSKSNKYLRDSGNLHKIVSENCVATAAFEGARVRSDGHVTSKPSAGCPCKRNDTHSSKKSSKRS